MNSVTEKIMHELENEIEVLLQFACSYKTPRLQVELQRAKVTDKIRELANDKEDADKELDDLKSEVRQLLQSVDRFKHITAT